MDTYSILKKRALVFDWDGTLFDSMEAKVKSFGEILSDTLSPLNPDATPEAMQAVYRANSGRPRRAIFSTAAKTSGVALDEAVCKRMSERLTDKNRRRLADAALFPDARAFLERLCVGDQRIFISSSVPQDELLGLVASACPEHIKVRLSGVFGSEPGFSKGPQHIDRILDEVGCSRSEALVFGDDIADGELAAAAGVDCILLRRSPIAADELPSISSFDELF